MEDHFTCAPCGFSSAVASLNTQPPVAPLLPRDDASEANALEYIFRGLAAVKGASVTATDVKRLTELNDEWAAAVVEAAKQQKLPQHLTSWAHSIV